jgi:hypothetical protein
MASPATAAAAEPKPSWRRRPSGAEADAEGVAVWATGKVRASYHRSCRVRQAVEDFPGEIFDALEKARGVDDWILVADGVRSCEQ